MKMLLKVGSAVICQRSRRSSERKQHTTHRASTNRTETNTSTATAANTIKIRFFVYSINAEANGEKIDQN